MTYQPFLISNYATGFDRELQPWLVPNDSYIDLLDGYVYRGVTVKRDGYSGFATGLNSISTESRMVHKITAYATGQTNTGAVLANITLPNTPVSRGSVFVTDGTTTIRDDGLGGFPTATAGDINYTTGVISGFQFPAASGTAVTVTFDYFPGFPVMGIMSFYPTNNVRQLVVADTTYVNKFNPSTGRLEDISSVTAYNCATTDFWSWVNYPTAANAPRLVFANGVVGDVIQQYDGSTIVPYTKVWSGGTLNARQIFDIKDRLVLFQTIENGVLFPRRIRISGTGTSCDNFNVGTTGAGFIDIPDNTWFYGAAANRDDVLFFTEAATWVLKYTNNDVTPFSLQRIDGSRGSAAAFSVISYLNRTMAVSQRGFILSDGYQVDRIDNNIPSFSFDSIDGNNFAACFSGFIDEDRDVYFIYPSRGVIKPPLVPAGSSDRILVINFEEDNFAIYRTPLSCMGNFQNTSTILWEDLTAANGYPSWDALATKFGNWNAFPFSKGTPIAIGGGHKGEIWKLNDTESEDNPVNIRDMVVIDSDTVRVTTDWNNYNIGDNIVFLKVSGMTQINNRQAAIKAISTGYTVFDVDIQTIGFDAYSGGGEASKTIPFEALTKKLNPWVEADKKVRCGWIYFYVSVTNTILKNADGTPVPALLDIDVITNDRDTDTEPTFKYQLDCSNIPRDAGTKQWVKIWINQTARFLQFRMSNNQAGAKIQVHAMMPGLQPLGRLV